MKPFNSLHYPTTPGSLEPHTGPLFRLGSRRSCTGWPCDLGSLLLVECNHTGDLVKYTSLLEEMRTANAMQIGTKAISLTLKAAPPAAGWLIVFSVNLHLITHKALLTGG